MRYRVACLTLLTALIANSAQAQEELAAGGDSLTYRQLVERVTSGDTLIDFTQLRFLFAAQPRPASPTDLRALFRQAELAEDHLTARELVDSALVHRYGHVGAHQAAARLFTERGDSARAEFHRALIRGFIHSIETGGAERTDGHIPVISIGEEYALLQERGLERVSQALGSCGEYRCDIIVARDSKNGDEFTFTFLLTWWLDQ